MIYAAKIQKHIYNLIHITVTIRLHSSLPTLFLKKYRQSFTRPAAHELDFMTRYTSGIFFYLTIRG